MTQLYFFLHTIEVILFLYLAFSAIYILVFAIAGKFASCSISADGPADKNRKFAVLIPGYKEDNVICEVARDALNQDYPQNDYDVVIIADSFKAETLAKLRELPVRLLEVEFETSTKSKALNKAMEVLGNDYDVALVLDADNLMAPDFIRKINAAFGRGFKIVQGHRIAKNTNTSFAVLDAISEEINNHIFRKGHRGLGLSSALIGSGMAFDYAMFKKRMREINAVGGFDKELELTFLRDGEKIEYLDNALVLDEKVQKVEVFENQRKRWLSAQFIYFGRFFNSGIYHLIFRGNIDFFDKVTQMISPPRILLIGITGMIALITLLAQWIFPNNAIQYFPWMSWMSVFIGVVIAFLFSIPGKFYNKHTLQALATLPKAFVSMFASLFKLKGANKKFIHTEHGTH